MKKTLLFSALVMVLSMTACNKEAELANNDAKASETRTVCFTSVPMDTKTVFGTPDGTNYPVLWTAEDTKVAITHNYKSPVQADVTRSVDNKTASFSGEFETGAADNTFFAVSPVSAVYQVASASKRIDFEIPSGQTSTASSPDPGAMVLYSRSAGHTEIPANVSLTFHHFTAYFHFVFSNYASTLEAAGATVQSVSVTSEKNLAGRIYYYPETGEQSIYSEAKTITVATSSLDDVWVGVTPADLSNETIKLTVNTSKGTITKNVKFGASHNLTAGKIAKVPVNLSGIGLVAPVRYNLVTNKSQLNIGDKIIVVGANFSEAMSTTQKDNNRAATAISKSEGYILDPSDAVEVIELEDGFKPGEYAFKVPDGYLYAACGVGGGAGNYLRTAAPPIDPAYARHGSWKINIYDELDNAGTVDPKDEVTEYVAEVLAEANARGLMRYNPNNGSGLFSAYATTTTGSGFIHLYRLDAPADASDRFKSTMPDADSDNKISVGSAGDTYEVYVFGNTAWTASVTGGATLSASSGTGNTILTLTVPANESTTDTKAYTVTVSTSASVVPASYTFSLTQAKAPSGGGSGPKMGDTLWEEWWTGGTTDQLPSEYCASGKQTTVVYGGGSVTYSEYSPSSSATQLKNDALVYYKSKPSPLPDNKYEMNLLIRAKGGYLEATGIPCEGVKTATLTYRSNQAVSNHGVSSTTTGVSVSSLGSSTGKTLDNQKNLYTISCTVSIPQGVNSMTLRITDINSGTTNIRVDGIELVVSELW